MPDFSLAAVPNFAQAALSGYQAGSAIGRQRRLDAALSGLDFNRPETALPVIQADPATGAAILGGISAMAKAQHETAGRVALGGYLEARMGAGAMSPGGSAAPAAAPPAGALSAPATPAAAQTPPASDASGDIVVTAARQPTALESATHRLIAADPETYLSVQKQIGEMDDNQRKRLDDSTSAFATVGQSALGMPYEQRKAYIQTQASFLQQHNISPDQIASFDPTDENLRGQVGKAIGVKGILERQDKDRSFGLQQDKFAHDVHHDTVMEGQGQQHIGIEASNAATSRGQLGVARGRLSLAKTVAGGTGNMSAMPTADLAAIARGRKAAPKPSASDIFAIAGDE